MKAILEFNLPEEKNELTMSIKGPDAYFCLMDLVNYYRKRDEKVRTILYEFMYERNIELDEID